VFISEIVISLFFCQTTLSWVKPVVGSALLTVAALSIYQQIHHIYMNYNLIKIDKVILQMYLTLYMYNIMEFSVMVENLSVVVYYHQSCIKTFNNFMRHISCLRILCICVNTSPVCLFYFMTILKRLA